MIYIRQIHEFWCNFNLTKSCKQKIALHSVNCEQHLTKLSSEIHSTKCMSCRLSKKVATNVLTKWLELVENQRCEVFFTFVNWLTPSKFTFSFVVRASNRHVEMKTKNEKKIWKDLYMKDERRLRLVNEKLIKCSGVMLDHRSMIPCLT